MANRRPIVKRGWTSPLDHHARSLPLMAMLSVNPVDLAHLIRERRECGGDRYDEVWDGVYVMSPLADNEHQQLGFDLAWAIKMGLGQDQRIRIFPGCNVSSRSQRWKRNFRCPDVAVFLPDNPAEDRKTHWFGGPDFAVEIQSPFDRSREKFGFYAKVRGARADVRRTPPLGPRALPPSRPGVAARRQVRAHRGIPPPGERGFSPRISPRAGDQSSPD